MNREFKARSLIQREVAYYGTDEPNPVRSLLSCGPLSAVLEAGALRSIMFRGREVLRAVAFLVRDTKWDTAQTEISHLAIAQGDDRFHVSFDATCRTCDGVLKWSADISATADGTIDFRGIATPETDFSTNRTGFVVLHPLDGVVGEAVEIIHSNGEKTVVRFPRLIDPEPCFTDIVSLTNIHPSGLKIFCGMTGGSWEMEDHRNWLDASFKTYIRPLSLPYPYVLKAAQPVEQRVSIRITEIGKSRPKAYSAPAAVVLNLGGLSGTAMPKIGLRAPKSWLAAPPAAIKLIKRAGIQLLHGRIDLRDDDTEQSLHALARHSKSLKSGLALELVVPFKSGGADKLLDFAKLLRKSRIVCESLAIAPSEDCLRLDPGPPPPPLSLLGELYGVARDCFPDQFIGGGVTSAFAELNRNWPPSGLVDFIFYPVGSLVHACDDQTLMENLQSIPAGLATAKAFGGGKPVRIIQSTLGLDLGMDPHRSAGQGTRRATLAQLDPRHRGLFGAAWALGAISRAALHGVSAIAPAALVGEFGIAHVSAPFAQPWFDKEPEGRVYPVFHVVKELAGQTGRPIRELKISEGEKLSAIAVSRSRQHVAIFAANTTAHAVKVKLPSAKRLRFLALEERSFEAAAGSPSFFEGRGISSTSPTIEFAPFAFARIDLEL